VFPETGLPVLWVLGNSEEQRAKVEALGVSPLISGRSSQKIPRNTKRFAFRGIALVPQSFYSTGVMSTNTVDKLRKREFGR
jgi:hypothetical protein